MNYKKEFVLTMDFAFGPRDLILCNIDGVIKEVQIVAIRIFADENEPDLYQIGYVDSFKNRHKQIDLVKNFISFIKTTENEQEENRAALISKEPIF